MNQVVATSELELKAGFLPAPEQPAEWPAWREKLIAWASAERARLGPLRYDPTAQAWDRCATVGFRCAATLAV